MSANLHLSLHVCKIAISMLTLNVMHGFGEGYMLRYNWSGMACHGTACWQAEPLRRVQDSRLLHATRRYHKAAREAAACGRLWPCSEARACMHVADGWPRGFLSRVLRGAGALCRSTTAQRLRVRRGNGKHQAESVSGQEEREVAHVNMSATPSIGIIAFMRVCVRVPCDSSRQVLVCNGHHSFTFCLREQ